MNVLLKFSAFLMAIVAMLNMDGAKGSMNHTSVGIRGSWSSDDVDSPSLDDSSSDSNDMSSDDTERASVDSRSLDDSSSDSNDMSSDDTERASVDSRSLDDSSSDSNDMSSDDTKRASGGTEDNVVQFALGTSDVSSDGSSPLTSNAMRILSVTVGLGATTLMMA
ncbi:hypothetical protein IV203_030583 [Nitzschia inconspicua]|uniref:Uncharacterized protein n=1 Tax=Nitzschia inconspicua TaxID=303405 RepID=A0A9K3Q2B7_9STRA|nr:hypothetical protein IV203_017610 [Nitzschia inconspicua]KAG7367840.1 hypothetical protein IV203_030583 [Nitzschia inconspicua]